MKNDFMLEKNNLNEPSQPFQKASQIITAVIVIFFVILIAGLAYYYSLTAELAILEVDKAVTGVFEQIEKDNKEIEEMERFNEWQERERNREFRELQR
ncbi:hypothetical protein ES703_119224 [subsurface metagenome]